ncbi:hypothetical protein NEOKW01_1292 [Nematocida sp. AWRm80]|nr:hypothetical protein NEOKW01_1292 [Nematocida sp. AWRm80]
MKVLLIAVLVVLASMCQGTMVLNIKDFTKPYVVRRAVIDNRISKGSFKIETPTQGSLNVAIFSEDLKKVFYKDGLKSQEKIDFSFNTTKGQTYTIQLSQKDPIPESHLKVEYQFDTQYNTFNKNVAKTEVIDPALSEMSNFEKLLYELSIQTSFRQKETAAFSDSINEIVISILCINFIMFVAFAGILAYQTISFKDFLKKKKLI